MLVVLGKIFSADVDVLPAPPSTISEEEVVVRGAGIIGAGLSINILPIDAAPSRI